MAAQAAGFQVFHPSLFQSPTVPVSSMLAANESRQSPIRIKRSAEQKGVSIDMNINSTYAYDDLIKRPFLKSPFSISIKTFDLTSPIQMRFFIRIILIAFIGCSMTSIANAAIYLGKR